MSDSMPSPEERTEQRTLFANQMMDVIDQLTPILDAADGMKADIISRGYSEELANQVASCLILGMISAWSASVASGIGAL